MEVQEEEMVRKLYSYRQMEAVREETKRRKADAREAIARAREIQRLEAQREHQAVAAAQLEGHRQFTLRTFESKEARHGRRSPRHHRRCHRRCRRRRRRLTCVCYLCSTGGSPAAL